MQQSTPINFWSAWSKIWAANNKLNIKGMDGITFYDNYNGKTRKLVEFTANKITLNGQRITGLSSDNPTDDSDVVTKKYVDEVASSLNVTNSDWHVGTESDARNIIIENDAGMIKTKEGTGNSLRLKADHLNGGQIVMHSPVSMPGMAGKVTAEPTDDGRGIINPNCQASSVVIITPTSPNHPAYYYITTENGKFTVTSQNFNEDPNYARTWSFNYLIINQ